MKTKLILILFKLLAFVALQCETRLDEERQGVFSFSSMNEDTEEGTDEEYVPEVDDEEYVPEVDDEEYVPEVDEEYVPEVDEEEVHIRLSIPGVPTQILNKLLTTVFKLERKAVRALAKVLPNAAEELDHILFRMKSIVENIVSIKGISNTLTELIGIVEDAISFLQKSLGDVSGDVATVLTSVMEALRALLAGIHLVKPAAEIAEMAGNFFGK